jgi:hypothetical protein
MLRTIGTVLLAVGFLALAGAWAITDPVANDANIGAGGLILLGRPAGIAGLVLIVADAVYRALRRHRATD